MLCFAVTQTFCMSYNKLQNEGPCDHHVAVYSLLFVDNSHIDDNHVTRFIQWRCVILIRSKTFFFKWSCNYYTRLCKTHARIHIFISGIIVFGRGRGARCFFHSLNLINVDFFRLGFWPTPCRSAHAKYGVNFLNEANVLTLTTK